MKKTCSDAENVPYLYNTASNRLLDFTASAIHVQVFISEMAAAALEWPGMDVVLINYVMTMPVIVACQDTKGLTLGDCASGQA